MDLVQIVLQGDGQAASVRLFRQPKVVVDLILIG